MQRRQLIFWGLIGSAVIALSAVFLAPKSTVRSSLPAAAHYDKLPEKFNQALQSARTAVAANGHDWDAVRKLARLYQANRLYAEARACYQMIALSATGLTARDHYYLADIAQNENDLAGAQAELRAVLKLEPNYVPARLGLAETMFKSGREDDAAKEYAAVLAIEPTQPQASLGLVRLALQRGDDDAAVARLEELMASHPEATAGAALFAQILERRGETERATAMTLWSRQKHEPALIDPWLNAMQVDCYDPLRLALLFEEFLAAGQLTEALPFLDRIEELDPKSWTPQLLRGWSQERAGHHREAVEAYRLALKKGGNPERICPLLTTSLLAVPDLPEAARMLAEYYGKLPESVPLLLSYTEVAVRLGDEKLARTLLAKLLELDPYLYTPNMSLAKILWTAGERDAAVQCLLRIVKVFPVDVASRGLLGQYYLEKADAAPAIRPLEEALAHVPPQTPAQERLTAMLGKAYLLVGNAAAEQGRFGEAVDYADKAIRLFPSELQAYALKANGCIQLFQYQRAAEALVAMAALEPQNPTILLSLGDVAYQDGKADQARGYWEKAGPLVAAGDAELRAALDLRLSGHITAETFK